MDELAVGREGVVIAAPPERQLYPRALALNPANRDTAKAVLDSLGLKPQANDCVTQARGVICLQEQTFLADVTGPEAPQIVAPVKDVEGQTRRDSLAAAALHASISLDLNSRRSTNGRSSFSLHSASVVV